MSNLNDIINLAKADGGKFFVMDEEGNAKLVIMSVENYQQLLLGKLQQEPEENLEEINTEIIKAQLTDHPISPKTFPKATSINNEQVISKTDLRAEVIDPSFDFEGPKIEIDDL